MSKHYVLWIIAFIFVKSLTITYGQTFKRQTHHQNKELAEKNDQILLFSTLNGSLIAIEKQTGRILWKIKDQPIVQVPTDTSDAIIPLFLPDPRDGSVYLLGNDKESIKKLPFTIPQLVGLSPCRSSDGILYTGKKKDVWFKIDPKTGKKRQVLGWDATNPTCPVESTGDIFVGRTKYDVRMVDSQNSNRRWNITFFHYTATAMSKEDISNYELVHLASTSTGRLLTMDQRSGKILWDGVFDSPVVGSYILANDGLVSIPLTNLANHAIDHITNELLSYDDLMSDAAPHRMKLYPTLYVGGHKCGLYALPSFVGPNEVTVSASDAGPLLLEGPYEANVAETTPDSFKLPNKILTVGRSDEQVVVFLGHYHIPKFSDANFWLPHLPFHSNLISDETRPMTGGNGLSPPFRSIGMQTEEHYKSNYKEEGESRLIMSYRRIYRWINEQDNKGLKILLIILAGCVVTMFWYLQVRVREFENMSQDGSRGSVTSARNNVITAHSEELPNGLVKVGKITFHPEQLLGKGCEGTFVYRGEFDSRRVAVKRLLPECFTLADREVTLLRESDTHPNVIRYYCTEQDRMFRYIALELCQATLSDYIEGKCPQGLSLKPLEILRQATSGLDHLHSLDIVHRDIKPHNVLISLADGRGEVKAMISDFGLCKKLQVGKVSFSRRSGVTGTDGWIAPEMMNGNERTTCAVDLFSLGCLFYYVLSGGKHAFGDTLRRQANILSGDYDLAQLQGDEWQNNIRMTLIAAMIASNADDRPPCKVILKHPTFWSTADILAFFQDVSDRVEKADPDDRVVRYLEYGGRGVVKGDWRNEVHEAVVNDLRKYRSYRGDSVRDLLRALRNKKHHFRELTNEAQQQLGDVPDAFTLYWTCRFPLLLPHVWFALQSVANERPFTSYYYRNYTFARHVYETIVDLTHEEDEEHPVLWRENAATSVDKNHSVKTAVKSYKANSKYQRNRKTAHKDEPLVWRVRE